MRQLTEQEMADARVKHLDILKRIDVQVEEKKNTVAIYNEEIKILHEQEREIRQMLISGQAQAEQLEIE